MKLSRSGGAAATLALLLVALPAAAATPAMAAPLALELPEGLPPRFELLIERQGEPVLLQLERSVLRAKDFRVRAWTQAEGYRLVEPPESRTYRGIVAGESDSVVGASLLPDGLRATVFPEGGIPWSIRPIGDRRHEIFEDSAFETPDLGGIELPEGSREWPLAAPSRPKSHDCELQLAEIAFDVDNPYFLNLGGVLADVVANVETHLAIVDAHYARDVQITYALTEIIVREDPFYFPTADDVLLVQFRDEWRANHQAVRRDIAHLMTGQPAPGLAGLAYVAVTCSQDWAYGWSVDSSGVVSHEIGHNWSSGHCHDSAPCNNMCGACLWIGPNTKDIIASFRDSATCLDAVGGHSSPLPPYAHPDRLDLTREDALNRSELLIDVLANDHDANCEELELLAFDAQSALGGSVRLSAGSGAFGHDALLYTPPCSLFVGDDRFEYRVGDGSGDFATGLVTIDLRDETLSAWWPLDEGAGDTAAELARGGEATLAGTPVWEPGPRGGALGFDGRDDTATIGAIHLPRAEASFCAWVRPEGVQAAWAGLIFTREAGTTAGINYDGSGTELRYHWEGASWDWPSGLAPPQGVWSFVALVIEPDQATLWLDDGSGLVSATHAIPHGLQTWAGAGRLGEDPTGGRLFRGALDDVRVFDHALTREQLEALVLSGGGNVAPRPADGSATPEARPELSWVAPADADEHDVYFGSDYLSVRDATPLDLRVHRGRQTATTWTVPELLLPGRTVSWRVDVVRSGVATPGSTWIFRSDGASPRLHAHWALDDDAGVAADSAGSGLDGSLTNAPAWTAGRWGGALQFDGADDFIDLPDLSAPSLPVTITLWLRRDGAQSPWAGLLFARGADAAGFNFGEAEELRYHWGNGAASWGWDSGLLVPDASWVLAALVIEREQATIWLHDGSLRSATNAVRHDAQALDGTVRIGMDPNGGPRFFRGLLDDLRIWSGALAASDLEELWSQGGGATNPLPADGAELAGSPPLLAWTPRPDAIAHELYLGESLTAVAGAGPGDAEHLGRLALAEFPLALELVPGARRYWRVDEVLGTETVRGRVWRFATLERIGNSLRVSKTGADEPELRWSDAGNGREYEVRRCEPPVSGSCDPAALERVGPHRADWVDAGAALPRLLWYRVVETGSCAP